MNKKVLFIILVAVVLGSSSLLLFRKSKSISPISDSDTSETLGITTNPASVKMKEYIDPAGFKFNYPETVTVSKGDSKGTDIYSSLELRSEDAAGMISLLVIDSKYKTLDAIPTTSAAILKRTKFGQLDAVQNTSPTKLQLQALDQGVLFTLTANLNTQQDFWLKVFESIQSTFSFVRPESKPAGNTTTTTDSSDDSVEYEGEEVVE